MVLELPGPLLLAGAGKMGGALIEGWLARGIDAAQIRVQEPAPSPAVEALLAKHRIKRVTAESAADITPSVIVAAVKPQAMDEVFPPLAKLAKRGTVVLSIAAGRT